MFLKLRIKLLLTLFVLCFVLSLCSISLNIFMFDSIPTTSLRLIESAKLKQNVDYVLFTSSNLTTNSQSTLKSIKLSNSNSNQKSNPIRYLIETPECKILEIPVFTHETAHLYQKFSSQKYECNKASLTSQIMRLNYTFVSVPPNLVNSCAAWEIRRKASNEWIVYGKSYRIRNSVTEFSEVDAVNVYCNSGKHSRIVPLIPHKTPKAKPTNPRPVNVLLLGIDSLSRLNFVRHFNRTQTFLHAHSFIPLYGHHKVGDNTWPNLMAILTGAEMPTWKLPKSKKLDSLPLIFKDFSRAGYLTTYIEDMASYGLFTSHQKEGFIRPPTDYYIRPVSALVNGQLNHEFCYQEKLEVEHYLEYIYDQMAAFRERGNQPFFTLAHFAQMTHYKMNNAQYLDGPIHRFLDKMFKSNLHKNTLIVFYSDHGLRYGKIVRTGSGAHESRLPVVYLYVPEGLKVVDLNGHLLNSEQIKGNLRLNSVRLTSQFDIHATLQHLLNVSPPKDELYGQSLITSISLTRTCEQAGIPEQYCLCHQYIQYKNLQIAQQLTQHLISHINSRLTNKYAHKCASIKSAKVMNIKIALQNNSNISNSTTFDLTIKAQPGAAIFQTILRANVDEQNNSKIVINLSILGDILRHDRYRDKSHCVAQSPVEKFCYCRDLL